MRELDAMPEPSNEHPLETERGPWRAVWHGGRLADVFHAEYDHAVACFEVTDGDLIGGLAQWVRQDADDYLKELAYWR